MTNLKLCDLALLYKEALLKAGFGPAKMSEKYNLVVNSKDAGNHLLYMLTTFDHLVMTGRTPKAMRWLGFIQHALVDLQLFSLEEIKDHARNADETAFPPPPGMQTIQTKFHYCLHCAHCGGMIIRMSKQGWMPQALTPTGVRFGDIDPDDRLTKLQGIGIHISPAVNYTEWDFRDLSYRVVFNPVLLHPDINEESISLALALLRDRGWSMEAEPALGKGWVERWEKHRKPGPECQCQHQHGPVKLVMGPGGTLGQLLGDDDEEDEEEETEQPKPKPKPKKKKGKKKDGNQEGEAGAGSTQE